MHFLVLFSPPPLYIFLFFFSSPFLQTSAQNVCVLKKMCNNLNNILHANISEKRPVYNCPCLQQGYTCITASSATKSLHKGVHACWAYFSQQLSLFFWFSFVVGAHTSGAEPGVVVLDRFYYSVAFRNGSGEKSWMFCCCCCFYYNS